jgi:hypothetical protein
MASRDLDNRKKLAVAKLELYAKALEDLRYPKLYSKQLAGFCAAILTFRRCCTITQVTKLD